MSDPTTIYAHAKVNLTLAVLGKRDDGFHEIESWVMPIAGMHDTLTLHEADTISLHVSGRAEGVPADESNLVWRAAVALAKASHKPCNVRIELTKEIPTGAGLGGGSSDAAATLLGLSRLWKIEEHNPILNEVAQQLGSDVPFFLQPGPALIRGRGEHVTPLNRCWHGFIGIVVPPLKIPTADVYRQWSAPQNPIQHSRVWDMSRIDAVSLGASLYNDLEPAAFSYEPKLATWAANISKLGRPARMTGSGSGFFTVFDNLPEGEEWSILAAREFPDACVRFCRTLTRDGSPPEKSSGARPPLPGKVALP